MWRRLKELLDLDRRVRRVEVAQAEDQAQIDALTARVTAHDATLKAQDTKIQVIAKAVDALKNQPGSETLDFKAVNAAVDLEEADITAAGNDVDAIATNIGIPPTAP